MASYPINKGVGRSIEVKGLRAQYVIYVVVGTVLSLLLLFLLLLLVHAAVAIAVGVVTLCTVWWSSFYLNNKYGENGLMHRRVARRVPARIAVVCSITHIVRREKSIY